MKKQKKPRTIPTLKQKLFATEYIKNGGNGTKAALQVYDVDYDSAKTIATQNIHKTIVQEELTKQLNDAGLGLQQLHKWTKEQIDWNMKGKPSQAVAANQIQWLYKLYNVLPEKRKMTMKVSVKRDLAHKDMTLIQQQLSELTATTTALLNELKST